MDHSNELPRKKHTRCRSVVFALVYNSVLAFYTTGDFARLRRPFLRHPAIKLYYLTLCVLYPKHYSYQHPSYLGVLDMCLILSLYLHVLSLSVGFRYHYLWYCFYVYLLIIFVCIILSVGFMYHYPLILFICIFIYVFIYRKSGISDLFVLMLFVLQCTDYKYFFLTLLTLTLTHPIYR